MLKMVDGTGIIGVDMVRPLGGTVSPPQPPNYDKVEVEGVGSLMLPNSLKAPLERVELIGNSVQLTTTGINLLPYEVGSKINSFLGGNTAVFKEEGIEITIKSAISTSEGDIYFFGNKQAGIEEGYSDKVKAGDYTILSNSKLCTFYVVVWRNGTSKVIINNSGEQMIHFTVLDGDKIRLFLRVKKSIDTEEAQIMLCKHTDVNLSYEPYTGLKPSPSPEYPQEIKSAGKWNEEKQKYEIDVKVTNSEQGWTEEQILTLTSDRQITKWDKLVEQGGSMGWLYSGKIAKEFTFVSKASDENISGRIRRRFKTSLNGKFPQTDKVMCNFLTTDNVRNDYSIGIVGSGDIYIYFYENTGVETLEQANHWLKNLPFEKTIIFERKTTEFVPLSESEQTQLRNLHSYNGTTNITVDSGEVPCGIKLTYRKEK